MYAAICAKKLGLPFGKLLAAVNENRILADVFESGKYSTKNRKLVKTKSPAMDIVTSSNFERLLSDLFGSDRTGELYRALVASGEFTLSNQELALLQSIGVTAHEIMENEATECQSAILEKQNYLLCPHSAIAAAACQQYDVGQKMLFAATVHPHKFDGSGNTAGSSPLPHSWLEQLDNTQLQREMFPGNSPIKPMEDISLSWDRKMFLSQISFPVNHPLEIVQMHVID